jgi:hypothetical protein
MKITGFIKTHGEVITVILAFAAGYFSLQHEIRSEIRNFDEKFYILLNKIHEIDKRMEIKFTQIDSAITK